MVDSGAPFHASPRRDFFASYKFGDYDVVRMGNKDNSLIVGVIDVKTNHGYKLVLKDMCMYRSFASSL